MGTLKSKAHARLVVDKISYIHLVDKFIFEAIYVSLLPFTLILRKEGGGVVDIDAGFYMFIELLLFIAQGMYGFYAYWRLYTSEKLRQKLATVSFSVSLEHTFVHCFGMVRFVISHFCLGKTEEKNGVFKLFSLILECKCIHTLF